MTSCTPNRSYNPHTIFGNRDRKKSTVSIIILEAFERASSFKGVPMTAPPEIKTTSSLYETDFVAWAQQQALLLKQGRLEDLDLTNLIVIGRSRSPGDTAQTQHSTPPGVTLGPTTARAASQLPCSI